VDPRRRWPSWLAAAAAAVVVAGGGIIGLQAMDEEEPTLPVAVSQVFEAEDARTATVRTENGGKLTVGVSQSRNEMAVDTRDLPELEGEQVYQLWAVHGEEMVSVGVLEDTDEGAAMGMPEEDTRVAVTVEPDGGSEQPTTAPIIEVDPREV
jgi:anti-sigma-K factor RskA